MNLRVAKEVRQALTRSQIEHGADDIGNGKPPFRENAAEVTDGGILDLSYEAVFLCYPFEFLDGRSILPTFFGFVEGRK